MNIEYETISSIDRRTIKTKNDKQEYFVIDQRTGAFADVPESWQVGHRVHQSRSGMQVKLVNVSVSPNDEVLVQFGIEA